MKKVICLYGGPGSGKSTTSADIFFKLKTAGYNCEMNREYIKDWVWEKRSVKNGDQTYFFAKQSRKERIYMQSEIEFIITDSPLVLTHFYGMKYDPYEQLFNTSLTMLKHHHGICKDLGYSVEHFFINRTKKYNPNGRHQDEETAKQYDRDIKEMLNALNIKYIDIDGDANAGQNIVNALLNKI